MARGIGFQPSMSGYVEISISKLNAYLIDYVRVSRDDPCRDVQALDGGALVGGHIERVEGRAGWLARATKL